MTNTPADAILNFLAAAPVGEQFEVTGYFVVDPETHQVTDELAVFTVLSPGTAQAPGKIAFVGAAPKPHTADGRKRAAR